MTGNRTERETAHSFTEVTARKILERAAEIDTQDSASVPVETLREVAREAGIDEGAFATALREAQSEAASADTQISTSADPKRQTQGRARVDWLIRNVGTAAGFFAVLAVLDRAAPGVDGGWLMGKVVQILASVIGVGLGLRLRSRVVVFALLAVLIAQLAELSVQSLFGIGAVQGGPTKWAVLIAATAGLGVGVLWSSQTRLARWLRLDRDGKYDGAG